MRDQPTRGVISPPILRKSRASLRLDAEVLEGFATRFGSAAAAITQR